MEWQYLCSELQNAAMLSEMVSDATPGTSNKMKEISFFFFFVCIYNVGFILFKSSYRTVQII